MESSFIFFLSLVLSGPIVSEQFSPSRNDVCRTPQNRPGTCIKIINCPAILKLLPQKHIPPILTFLQKSECGREGNYPKVCCEQNVNDQHTTNANIHPTTTSKPWENSERFQSVTSSEPQAADVTSHPNLRFFNQKRCGQSGLDRIIGGNMTGIQEFPWMALLAYNTGLSHPEFKCGGSVINERYILTAAHCLNKNLFGVRVGEHNLKTEIDCTNIGTENEYCNDRYQDFTIEQAISHPEYSNLRNDIALLRLNRKINLKLANSKAICLPIGSAAELPSEKLLVTGWGVTNWRDETSPVMLKVDLPRFPQEECVATYKDSRFKVSYKQICAGGEGGKDACQGDSGGPLQAQKLFPNGLRFVQYGIVSFGTLHCGTEGKPNVFTRVDHYLPWILDNIRD